MPTGMEFPAEAIDILRQTRFDPDAKRSFDGMSGGFRWDDEFPNEAITACMRINNYAFRVVIAYRASLVSGKPREELRASWDQLLRECPEWPGFRPDRQSTTLKGPMERANERFMSSLRRLDNLCNRPEV